MENNTNLSIAEMWFQKGKSYMELIESIDIANVNDCIEYYANAINHTEAEEERKEMYERIRAEVLEELMKGAAEQSKTD